MLAPRSQVNFGVILVIFGQFWRFFGVFGLFWGVIGIILAILCGFVDFGAYARDFGVFIV